MISNINIKKHLGKNIAIYPFDPSKIEGASLDLTASGFAWSANKKKRIPIDAQGKITIQPKDTAIILTKEAIWLDKHFAGTCHARLKLGCKGLLFSNSPIKPGWVGRLTISIYNNTDKPQELKCGEPIVVVMLYELKSAATITAGSGTSNRFDVLSSVGIPVDGALQTKINGSNNEFADSKRIVEAMRKSREFIDYTRFELNRSTLFTITLILICLGCSVGMILAHTKFKLAVELVCAVYTIMVVPLWTWVID